MSKLKILNFKSENTKFEIQSSIFEKNKCNISKFKIKNFKISNLKTQNSKFGDQHSNFKILHLKKNSKF